MFKLSKRALFTVLSLVAAWVPLAQAQPLSTAFTFQGEMRTNGLVISGRYDMQFRLYDALAGGAQLGPTLCIDNIFLVNGRVNVELDFGVQFTGQERYVEFEIRPDIGQNCADPTGYTTLSPRQVLTATPNAQFALSAGNAVTATTAQTATSATTAVTATTALTANNATQFNGQTPTFYQNAANLNAGTLPDARLSSAVTLLSGAQTFTGPKTFSAAPSFTGPGVPFSVSSNALVTNLNADLLDGLDSSAFLQGVPTPLTLLGSNSAHIIRATNSFASTGAIGVQGWASAATGATYGVYGQNDSTSGTAVYGTATASTGTTFGVDGQTASTSGRAIYGTATATTGTTFGVFGQNASTGGQGVFGWATTATGTTYGVFGRSDSVDGYGVYGQQTAAGGTGAGVFGSTLNGKGVWGKATASSGAGTAGQFESSAPTGAGVVGLSTSTTGSALGGDFECVSPSGIGLYGNNDATTGTSYGILGRAPTAASGFAIFANGDLGSNGLKSFRIDHPDDPANKYLLHYSAESPEVINFYSGNAVLDSQGQAVIELPRYFGKINKDPRYTLTAVGAPMPMLHVAEEISEEALKAGEAAGPDQLAPTCSFRIGGGLPGGKVSWRVEALRNDLRVRLHGAPVEREKSDQERGKYQHPEYYGLPAGMASLRPSANLDEATSGR